ncbi:hypothetical protein VTJ49DRAFT_289 [Mycothermus thermophilus]|uniref:P-type ATPase N-terminal domain-containing protein n=1 Tax=Humicola insolens TaxID=85995 RepID=A0ABR3VGF9_HUMIN
MEPPRPEEGNAAQDVTEADLITQRSRWATRKLTVKSSAVKRLSLRGRGHHKNSSIEKKRVSGGTDISKPPNGSNDHGATEEQQRQDENHDGPGPRELYFGLPLPRELQDDDGEPIQQFTRNKIRTAKYTPLSFIPKNLFFQFQNVANIFFLFLVILVVSPPGTPPFCSSPANTRADNALSI